MEGNTIIEKAVIAVTTSLRNLVDLIAVNIYYCGGWIIATMKGVRLSSRARISPYADIGKAAYIGEATIGREVVIGKGTYVNSGQIASGNIGDYCSIAYNVMIGLTEHKPDYWTTSPYEAVAVGESAKSTVLNIAPPIIGNRVWIGANAIVLRGVIVGEGAIVAAGAVVTKNIPPNEIWGGVPARCIRIRDN